MRSSTRLAPSLARMVGVALALPRRYAPVWPAVGLTLTFVGAIYCALAIAGYGGIGGCHGTIVSCDAASYYYANGYEPVAITPQYGYSPAYQWASEPFRLLPFDVFVWIWAGLHVAALLWLRAGWMLAIPGVNEDVIRGNVTVFVALAVVVGMRHGATWAFPLLTKVLPGVGIVWHLVRREWRHLAWALGATGAIVLLGLTVDPSEWIAWLDLLRGEGTETAGSLVPRIIIGVMIVAYAAWTDRAWLVPVGMLMAWSYIWLPAVMVLAAIPRLIRPMSSLHAVQPDIVH